jgi:hypothetical protein
MNKREQISVLFKRFAWLEEQISAYKRYKKVDHYEKESEWIAWKLFELTR